VGQVPTCPASTWGRFRPAQPRRGAGSNLPSLDVGQVPDLPSLGTCRGNAV